MHKKNAILLHGVSKYYEKPGMKIFKKGKLVLKDINISIPKHSIFGIIGENGSGKSTLLKLINGTIEPSTGMVLVCGKTLLLNIGGNIDGNLTGLENIKAKGIANGKIFSKQEIDQIIEFSELRESINRKVREYSNGMRARLGFAIAIKLPTEILLIDETLAVGDTKFQKKCRNEMEILKNEKTIVICAHSESVMSICDKVLMIKEGIIYEK